MDAVLAEAVRDALKEASQSGGEMTARTVRHACERHMGLPPDGLLARKEEVMAVISAALSEGGTEQVDSRVDAAAVREIQAALDDAESGPTRAVLLVTSISGQGLEMGREVAEVITLLSEACATSEVAARRMLDAQVTSALAALIPPTAPKPAASLALRLLSAMAMHLSLTEALVRSPVLPPLLARLNASLDGGVGVQCATLLHSLADSPASRMRLLHAGALGTLTRVMVEPSAADGLKEHCLQAVASLAGQPESSLSLPDFLGVFAAAKAPGTQRAALAALQILREKVPGVEVRLAQCESLVDGLRAAARSADSTVAAQAAELLAALSA